MKNLAGLLRMTPFRALWASILLALAVWCTSFVVMFSVEMRVEHARFDDMMALKAEMLYQNTQAIRRWVGAHGGIYVEVDETVHPNPLLAMHPERDIITPSGRQLTLYNSPALLRRISEDFEAASGTRIRLVSPTPLNLANAPIPWEKNGYAALESGRERFTELTQDRGVWHFRLLRPMILKKRCLSCHTSHTVDEIGSMVGAVSIDLDVTRDQQAHEQTTAFLLASHIGFWGLGVVGIAIGAWRWRQLLQKLQRLATHDPLTGLYNRRELMGRLDAECKRAIRYGTGLAVMMLDVDHFKQVNDHYGHRAGDEVLRRLAKLLHSEARCNDTLARYGGEEIVVLCPNTDLETAMGIAERIRASAMNMSISTARGELQVTVSIGVVAHPPVDSVETLLERADSAMYQAKEAGRNRVSAATAD